MSLRPFSTRRATDALALATGAMLLSAVGPTVQTSGRTGVETLRATGGLPAHIAGRFQEPIGFAVTPSGEYVVLDRRAHTVYAIDRERRETRRVIQIGFEEGRVLSPAVLSLGPDDVFAVADGPPGAERVQYFSLDGLHLGGFFLARLAKPAIRVGPFAVNGIDSMTFTGRSFLINRPGLGSLFAEYDLNGYVTRQVGALRATGQEPDPAVHEALNAGLPLVDPAGGFYFVFHSGRPMFQKFSAEGTLLFERHIEGPELDAAINRLPTTWRADERPGDRRPVVEPLVRAAAIDARGRLWISLVEPVTYVYGPGGEKLRTVEFQAAGIIAPTSLFFTPTGRLLVTPGCYEFKID